MPVAADRLGLATVGSFALVVLLAGASGIALLGWPGSTHRYFSWGLGPEPTATLIGGLYLASSAVFAWALTLPWRQVRPLVVGVLGLAVPTFVLTLVHDEVFDFGRWQAWAWVVLFAVAPLSAVGIMAVGPAVASYGPKLRRSSRLFLVALALLLATLAVLIWVDGTRDDVARRSPVELVRLTGAYLGAWCSFVALLCGWAAARGRWDDARVALGTLAAIGTGAAIGFLRLLDEVRWPAAAVLAAVGLVLSSAAVYVVERPR